MRRKIVSILLTVIFICSISLCVFAAETAIRPDTSEAESIIVSNQQYKEGTVTFDYSSDKLEVGDAITVMFYKPVGPEGGPKDCIIYKADGQLTTDDLSNIYYIDQFEVKDDKKIGFVVPEDLPGGTYNLLVGGTNINSPTLAAVDMQNQYIPGDVNSDGKVTRMDLLRLAKNFSGFVVEIDEAAADVTGDGNVTRTDLLRLAKHFSGFDVVLGK